MQNAETKTKRLNAEAGSVSSFFLQHSAFVLIALLALAVRLPQLGVRPMHTDEAINAYLTGQSLAGESYHYDPQDRHGPALVEFTLPLVRLAGANSFSDLTETRLRLVPVIAGSVTVLLFGAAVELFGFIPCLVAALLFAIGPLPVYYSRYFIHETMFVAATFGLMVSGWRAWRESSLLFAGLAGGCAGLMLACKETAVIHFFALGLAVAVGRRFQMAKKIPPVQICLAVATAFIFTAILLFTWGGQNWSALADLVRAIPNFAARAGGQGHEKSFGYYFVILDPLFVFFVAAAAGIYAVICDAFAGRRTDGLVLAIYALLIFLIYSAIPYKTPWLALNLWLPLALLCGLGVEGVWQQFPNANGRWVIAIVTGALLLVAGEQTKTLAFDHPAGEQNPLAYAQTTEDILGLPQRLKEICQEQNLVQPRIAVVAKDPWPLPWYLRKFSRVGFWQPNQETGDADFFITTTDVSGKLAERLKNYRPEYFGVRPNVLLILWSPPATDSSHE